MKHYDATKEFQPFAKLDEEKLRQKYGADRQSRSRKGHDRGPNVRTCSNSRTAVRMAKGDTKVVTKVWYHLRAGACVSHKLA